MAHATDIVGYTYNADLYCSDCILTALGVSGNYDPRQYTTEEALTAAASGEFFDIDRHDESSFGSGDFPKVVFRTMLEDGDRCGSCGEILGE